MTSQLAIPNWIARSESDIFYADRNRYIQLAMNQTQGTFLPPTCEGWCFIDRAHNLIGPYPTFNQALNALHISLRITPNLSRKDTP